MAVVVVALAAVGAFFGITWARVARGGRSVVPPSGDVIAVFGARVVEGRPCAELRARLAYGAALWRAGRAPRVLCLGGSSQGSSEAEAMRTYLVELGVPEGVVAMDEEATSTRGAIAALARRERGRKVLAVSSPYHMRRIASEARRQAVDVEPCPPPTVRVTTSSRTRLVQTLREIGGLWWYACIPPPRPSR
jgi:uncharacterized SAM-binding protein YcdF (DUF218 family)